MQTLEFLKLQAPPANWSKRSDLAGGPGSGGYLLRRLPCHRIANCVPSMKLTRGAQYLAANDADAVSIPLKHALLAANRKHHRINDSDERSPDNRRRFWLSKEY